MKPLFFTLGLCATAALAAGPTPVKLTTPKRADIHRWVTLPGTLKPNQQATLYAKVVGYLTMVAVDKGDTVKAGQPLGELEVPELLSDSKARVFTIERDKLRDEISRQVVEAHTRVHSLADQLVHARAALSAAEQALKLARERKAFAVGEVLESIQAEHDLAMARLEYLNIVTENNRAQYLLRRAVGDAAGTHRKIKQPQRGSD